MFMKKSFFICLFAFISIVLKAQIYSENISLFTLYDVNGNSVAGLIKTDSKLNIYYNENKNITSIDIIRNNEVILHKLFYKTYVFINEIENVDIAIFDITTEKTILHVSKLYIEDLDDKVNVLSLTSKFLSLEDWIKIKDYFIVIKKIN